MGKKSGGNSTPQIPDPEKIIHAQGIENIRGGLATTALNRYNVNTPYGTVRWNRTPAIRQISGSTGSGNGGGTTTSGIGSHADQDPLRGMSEGSLNNWGPNSGGTLMGVYDSNESRWLSGGAVHEDGSFVGSGAHPFVGMGGSAYDDMHYYMQPMGQGKYSYYYKGQDREAAPSSPSIEYIDLWRDDTTGTYADQAPSRSARLDPNSAEARYMAANGGGISGGSGRFAPQRAHTSGPDVPMIYAGDGSISNIGGVGVGVGGEGIAMSPLDQWTQTIELNPEEQQVLDESRRQKIAAGAAVTGLIGKAGSDTLFSGGAGSFAGTPINRGAIANTIGFNESGARTRLEDAIYNKYKARLDPRFSEGQTRLEEKLINMGQARGGELWNEEQARYGRERTDAYEQAQREAIIAGETSLGNEFARSAAEAQFGNQAQQQDYAQQMGISQQDLQLRQQANSEMLQQMALLSQAQAGIPLNGAPSQIAPPAASIGAVDAAGIYNADTAARMGLYNKEQDRQSDKMGNMISAAGTVGSAFICWVAREAFGHDNLKWLEFRRWMVEDAPAPLRDLYVKYGEAVAAEIANDEDAKADIRAGMELVLEAA